MIAFEHTATPSGAQLRLMETAGLFQNKQRPVAFANWPERAPSAAGASVARLKDWELDGRLTAGDDGSLHLPHELLAELSEPQARSLGLPGAPPYSILLEHQGTFDQPECRFQLSWREGFQPVQATQNGAWLSVGQRRYRLSKSLLDLCEAVKAFNAAPKNRMEDRFREWARVRPLLDDLAPGTAQASHYLQTTIVAQATRFGLAIQVGRDGPQLTPILFGPASADDDATPSEWQALLPPVYQECFAQQRFPASDECRSRYAIGDGNYVVVDEALRECLTELRRVQQADAATRLAFARNPMAILKTRLKDRLDDLALDAVFVVTEEFSARVIGDGLWEKPVVPWIKLPSNDWFGPPESFGIRIGDQTVPLDAADIPTLTQKIEDAITKGEANVEHKGQRIPATAATLEALSRLQQKVKPSTADPGGANKPPPQDDGTVLLIHKNFEQLDFESTLTPRTARCGATEPATLRTPLKAHQKTGLSWLQAAWVAGLPGVLLADDMGLGKTLQALSFLAWLRHARGRPSPVLIVAPAGLLINWEEEARRHLAPEALGSVVRATGRQFDTTRIRDAGWVLTTYETVRDHEHALATIDFQAVVFDEMQKVKAPDSLATKCAKALRANFVLGMTGTPVENRLGDLWCLMDRVWPGYLGDIKTFSTRYEKDSADAEPGKELQGKLLSPGPARPPLLLRRMKQDHLDGLPRRTVQVIRQTMPKVQADAYSQAVEAARNSDRRGAVLEALQALRSISLHPLDPSQGAATPQDEYIAQSARLVATFKILDDIHSARRKALVFVESLALQDWLVHAIQRRYKLKELPLQINGGIVGTERQKRVNAFQSRPNEFEVMVLSPKAGGVGITLTAANHVIHLSRWWNPAVEDQCSDRVYRIGQQSEVHLYFPLAVHPQFGDASFDLTLDALLTRKRTLSRDFLAPAGAASEQELRALFEQVTRPVHADNAAARNVSLTDIDGMEPRAFERWVAHRLQEQGWQVRNPPQTHDSGADVIAQRDGRRLLVQCKHTSQAQTMNQGVDDLLRARRGYGDADLVLVTNASGFTAAIRESAGRNAVRLVDRQSLVEWHG